ncbi:hypothetical protein AEV80_17005 [Salmonella enterica subsp. enterica serovar Brandenburg]|nr:hypothetical protein Y007_07745 [Salmonella enterica subsp. enterica serovar Montevideo str. 507440-20]KAK00995.1 hypothetical protein N925_03930 [Salmonella enterica subsp. enterica serovar 9,12:l,v:- str. 94293]KHP25464.1 hypothetical protein QS22_13430 [Salmonella enterica subsp. enterica serovar Brandenburg]KNL68900.1 hypothetical protein AEU75_14575 [Salmonella enterica subsp. enterica serovar Reading]KNM01843.1 hypothetical protein AEU81_03235 [Salmonella enterica subsp. enterica serov
MHTMWLRHRSYRAVVKPPGSRIVNDAGDREQDIVFHSSYRIGFLIAAFAVTVTVPVFSHPNLPCPR